MVRRKIVAERHLMSTYQCCVFDRSGKATSTEMFRDDEFHPRTETLRRMIDAGLCAHHEVWTEGRIVDSQTGTDEEHPEMLR